MAKNIHHFKGFSIITDDVRAELDMSRFTGQFNKAQYRLDSQVMTDMVPLMPMQTGTFINVTRAISASMAGTGIVCAAAPPMGRFLYEGKVMVDVVTRSAYARPGARKEVIDKPLQYSTHAHPDVTDHWFDAAKKIHGKEWVEEAKQIAGGG